MRLPTFLLLGAGLLSLTLLQGCGTPSPYVPPPDDAGDRAWARQVIPVVLGRKPKSLAEIEGVVRLSQQAGRESALDALLATDDFVVYWHNVLLDDLQVDRGGALTSPNLEGCDVTPSVMPDTATRRAMARSLTAHIRGDSLQSRWCWWTGGIPEEPVLSAAKEATSDEAAVSVQVDDADALEDPVRSDASLGVEDEGSEEDATGVSGAVRGLWEGMDLRDGLELASDQPTDTGAAELGEEETALAEWSEALDAEYELRWAELSGDPDARAALTEEYAAQQRGIRGVKTCADFNLADVLVAGIEGDDLAAVYLANLSQLATAGYRDTVIKGGAASKVLSAYTNRNPDCLQCHSSSYSVTDARPLNDEFDRTHPAERWDLDVNLEGGPAYELDLEMGAFSWYGTGGVGDGRHGGTVENALLNSLRGYFMDAAIGTSAAPGVRPWGIAQTCVQNALPGTDATSGVKTPTTASGLDGAIAGSTASQYVGPLELIGLLRTGMDKLEGVSGVSYSPYAAMFPDDVYAPLTAQNILTQSGCTSCHGVIGTGAPDLSLSAADISRDKIIRIVQQGSPTGAMPAQPLSDADAAKAADAVRSLVTGGVRPAHATGSANLAHLLAQNIVDNVMEETTGARLTLAHGFPRNAEQAALLSYLTDVFVQSGWSLRALVKTILLEDGFNRAAPAASTNDPYTAPPVLNPWGETAATQCDGLAPSGEACNGVSDAVTRFSATNTLTSFAAALAVPVPSPFTALPPGSNTSLTKTLDWSVQAELGRYVSPGNPQRPTMSYQNLLRYDDAFYQCKPGGVSPTPDWIDTFSTHAAAQGWTVLDALTAVKVRLHGTNTISTKEQTLLQAYYQKMTSSTADIATTPFVKANASVLRQFCGALLLAPQFQMRGLPDDTPTTGLDVPVFDPNEPTDADAWCNRYGAEVGWVCP